MSKKINSYSTMRKIIHLSIVIFAVTLFYTACGDTTGPIETNNDIEEPDLIEEKMEEISEIGTTFLPSDILDSYLDVSDLPEDEQIEYLDTLKVAVLTFRDTLLTYYSIPDLEKAFNEVNQASAKLKREKGYKSEAELFNNIRLGYGKSAQLSLGGESGLAAGIGVSIASNGGGGIEVLYDFVNVDREIYTSSFCYLGGSVLFGAGVDLKSFEVGFSGINKWILNISSREGVGKFEGASRGASFGASLEIEKALGVSAGLSLAQTQDVLASGNFTNASVCPSGFAFDPNPSGVKEYSFETNVSVSSGVAKGLVAAIDGGVLGSYRTPFDGSFTNFGREKNERKIAAFKMAIELISQYIASSIISTPTAEFDLKAAVFAFKYGKITYEDIESASPSIIVAPDLINASATASKHYINISNIGSGNLEWLISTEEDWIEIGDKSGSGEDKVEINILENTTESFRSGNITINSNGGDEKTIMIQQEALDDIGSNIVFGDFGLTKESYPSTTSNWDQVVTDVFGPEYRVADWNDLVSYYEKNGSSGLKNLLDNLGVTERGTIGSVTRDGDRSYSSSRYYFASRHDNNKPSHYLAHDNIDNFLVSLGSWDGDRPILAKKLESTPESGIYSENFESDPGFSVKYSLNTESKADIYWDENAEIFYASVKDQPSSWYSLGYSPFFAEVIDPNSTDFIINFEFNPVEPDWGHYPGIYFLKSGDPESPHELQRALQFTINWSDNTYKKFRLIGFNGNDSSQFLSQTIPNENEWYTIQIVYKSDEGKIDLIIRKQDGSIFVKKDNLEIPINNSFDQLAIGEIQGATKYGSKSIIRIDNISINKN